MGFALGGSFVWGVMYSPPHQNAPQNQQAESHSSEKEHKDGFWEKAGDDPVAYFTLWLVGFTGVLAISTIGLWIVTWRASVSQARDMQESILAAKDSTDIARTSLISTQRAYVRVVNFPWLWRADYDRPGKFFYDITPIIENGGNTQTVDAKINVNSALRDDPLPEGFDFPFVHDPGFTLIGAHQSVGASNAVILDDDLLLVQGGTKYFYIWGAITYRDVFPNTPERVTEFSSQISRVMGNPLDPQEPGNPKGTTLEIYFRIYPEHQKTT
jgi:hypothetical protein